MTPLQLQSSLGKGLKQVDSDDFKIKDLLIGRVTKVNYITHSVEVNVNNTTLGSSPLNSKEDISVPYPRNFIGTTPEGNTFGGNSLLVPGTVVLVGFLDSSYSNPIIVATYGTNTQSKLLSISPLESGTFKNNDNYKYFSAIHNLYPSMTYDFHDGEGSMIKTFNGKTFLSITSNEEERPQATDYFEGTSYYDLYPSYYSNKKVKEPRNQQAPDVLFKHQGMFDDNKNPDNHITTFYIDRNGTIRFSVMEKDLQRRTFFEIDNEGNQRTTHQGDSLLLDESQVWVEYGIDSESNSFYIKNDKHKFEFTSKGLYIDEKPILDNLDNSVEQALKNLQEVQKGLEEINYLLEGVGKENIEELIKDTKHAIETSTKASKDVSTFTDQLGTTNERLESAIKKYDTFMNTTMKDYMETVNGQIANLTKSYQSLNNIVTPLTGISERVTELQDNFEPTYIHSMLVENYLTNKSKLTVEQVNTEIPTIILIQEDIKSNESYSQDLSNFSVELLSKETEEQRVDYIDKQLKTLEDTPLKKLVGNQEYTVVVKYKTNNSSEGTFITTNYELLYNTKFIPLETTKSQSSSVGIISKFKIGYEFNSTFIEEKSFTSTDW